MAKYDYCHVHGAEDGELMSFLEEAAFTLKKRATSQHRSAWSAHNDSVLQ